MSVNLKKFRAGLAKERERLTGIVAKEAQIAVGQFVYERMIQRTPVLTGHARHNWRPSVNTQVSEEQEGVYGGRTTGDPITAEERGRWRDAVKELKSQPLGQTLWICNNAPYILKLEHGGYPEGPGTINGFSKKAPNGIVAITLREVIEGVALQQPKMLGGDAE